MALILLPIAACDRGAATTTTAVSTTTTITAATTATSNDLDSLIAAAQAEGTLTTIALPRDLCDYGRLIDAFSEKYGVEIIELAPEAGSAEALEAIRASQGGAGPEAPDVIDVWLSLAPEAQAQGLVTPYRVSTWETIPTFAKDADGYWAGGYYGILGFEVNADVVESVPIDWVALMDPQYQGQISLAGDPRVSNQAIFSVYAAALARGGSLDNAQPGLDFFAQLNDVGNLASVIADAATVQSGETPVAIRWTYNALTHRDAQADVVNIEVVVPATGRLAGLYVQAISAFAPHPNAAKLWMEYVYSDEGQLGWLSGHCNPIRYQDLVERDAIPVDLMTKAPDPSGVVFPSLEQINAATELITTQWDAVVGVDIGG